MDQKILLDTLGVVVIGLLVLANGFFVAAEFSLVSVRRTRIAELAAHGLGRAETVQKVIEKPGQVIAATQLGITLSSLALGWMGEPALAHLFEPVVALLPKTVQTSISHGLSASLAFILITFLTIVAGELAPKSIALQNPERVAFFVAGPTLWIERVLKPAIWVLNGAGNGLLKLMGVKPALGQELVHSVEELRMLVTASTEGGVVQEEESDMLHAVFDFGELVVRQVMVPRTEVVGVEAETVLPEIINMVTNKTFTKFPVYEENLDQTIGIVHVKDLLKVMQNPDCQAYTARQVMREALYVPETLPVSALLHLFRANHQHIAISMDEYGGTAGLVTLEDLMEEIVGEVSDQFDQTTPEFQTLPDGSILIDGLTLLEDVNQQLDLNLQEPNYDTIAGYVLGRLGRIPHPGDEIEAENVRIRVEEMDGLRIAHLALTRLQPSLPDSTPPKPANEPEKP